MSIQDLGWDAYFEAQWNAAPREGCMPVRVVAQHRGLWRVGGEFGEGWAEPSGKLRLAAGSGADWPAVGDWVGAEFSERGKRRNATLHEVLARRSKFSRKEAGKRIAEQVIAANIDIALIVAALDGDFNERRIERYVTQCWDSGARPVVVLNKADTCSEVEERKTRVETIVLGAPVFAMSAKTGDGVDDLVRNLKRGQTAVLLGSSGVGKSTLLNRMLRKERQTTQPVRENDSRGRHTTTARQLLVLPGGALLIDTPGLRELQLWDAESGVAQTFAEIEELAARCGFRDCKHEREPGCAVREAMQRGQVDARRLENMRKLEREQAFLARKKDPEKQHEYKKQVRILFRAIRQDSRSRDKGRN